MRIWEFLIERFVREFWKGDVFVRIDEHVYDQGLIRDVSRYEVDRIIKRIPFIKHKLSAMRYYKQFYLRDADRNVELGCRYIEDDTGYKELRIITSLKRDTIRKSDTPTIVVNAEFTQPLVTKRIREPRLRYPEIIDEQMLAEGATDILYHYAPVGPAISILKSGKFGLSFLRGEDRRNMPPGYDFFLSTTRSRVGDYHRTTGNIAVMFVLDGRAIAQRYRVIPVDYWEQSWLDTHGTRTRESEDRILSQDETMDIGYAREIHILVKDYHNEKLTPARVRTMIDLAEQRGIPHWTYFNDTAWRLQDKRRALDPEHERAYFQGELPPEKDYTGTVWAPTDYVRPWVELLDFDPSQRGVLGKQAQEILRKLNYGTYRGDDYGLAQDLGNASRPHNTGRDSVVRLVKFMRKNRMTIPEFVEYLRLKWEPK